ncbi:UDP-N-acetylglucosamine 2-epimerase (non-hydrolyzing) [Polynucleobacter sp. 39-46-10]|uniref:non-hydrolyzing UDP-N-acetylglucosamine 2-epimerase n=1 Tax=Polynucleobacter sp. 39-46-10 TaxID=1970428 RepID=UPI000BCB4B9E|nr:UDP-N-acetylglucosamine 2-epimerase (non-hydrolyzing) [Polynucleobacter sp. 39-46-10]OZA76456.1 MAG: UDP-N-acetylglucosamine 2-epimerase (non-hydrolyzing) [Polynucleobacter sp. 39-46-10]
MRKLKVMTIVGTRPEIIRLSRVIEKLDQHCDHVLVHTGQNYDYELNEVFFSDLGIRKPDAFLEAAGTTAAETIGQVIISADKVMQEHVPEALLVLGDTNSCLAAISAKRRKIPIFHMEAGNRCFDFRVPEEINRRIVDHTSDINLTYSDIAREYLLREGLPPDQVIKTGSPMREVIEYYREGISASAVLSRLELKEQQYFLVSSHREENVDAPENLQRLFSVLNALAEKFALPVIVSTHPRTRKRMDVMGLGANALVQFHKPFGFLDYVRLQTAARAVLSDSGTITEESSILNFPAVNLREVQERPEGFEEGAVMFVGMDVDRVLQALDVLASQPRGELRTLRMVEDYAANNVSDKVVRILLSYTDFVNRKVWHKA